MGCHDRLGHRGRRSRHHRCSLSSPSSSCSHRRTYRDAPQRGRPPSQDERELISDRQSSQRVPGAATSPIVACSPDGRGAVYSRRSLSVSKRAACYDQGSPVASTSIADAIFLRCPLLSTNQYMSYEIATLLLDKCTLKTRLMQQANSIYFAQIPSSNHYLFHHKNDQWSHFY